MEPAEPASERPADRPILCLGVEDIGREISAEVAQEVRAGNVSEKHADSAVPWTVIDGQYSESRVATR